MSILSDLHKPIVSDLIIVGSAIVIMGLYLLLRRYLLGNASDVSAAMSKVTTTTVLSREAIDTMPVVIVVESSSGGGGNDNKKEEQAKEEGEGEKVEEEGAKQGGAGRVCAICLADVAPGDALRELPACGHSFHVRCVDTWLRKHSATCPVCRTTLLPDVTSSSRFLDCLRPTAPS